MLGHPDEDVAREILQNAYDQFLANPNPSLHHRITLNLFWFASQLKDQVMAFLSGVRRRLLPMAEGLCLGMIYMVSIDTVPRA